MKIELIELILDMLKIQLADYKESLEKYHSEYMRDYFKGKINATYDIIDRIKLMS